MQEGERERERERETKGVLISPYKKRKDQNGKKRKQTGIDTEKIKKEKERVLCKKTSWPQKKYESHSKMVN